MAEFADLSTGSLTVHAGGVPLDLTPYEFRVLSLLVADAAAGKPLTPLSHLDLVAPARAPEVAASSNVLQVVICRIRRKLKDVGAAVQILTVWGQGYALRATIQRGNADLVPAEHATLGKPA